MPAPAPLPPAPECGRFDGGCAFVEGAYVPLSEAKISLFDWGFTRSDATYDVASTWGGAFFRLQDHLERFEASLAKLRLSTPYDRAQLREILHGCVRGGGLKDAYVGMVCTRGVPPRGARDPRLATNRFYAFALPYVWIAPPEKQGAGIDLHIATGRIRIPARAVDPTIKNYHWQDLVAGLFEAYDLGRDTVVLLDADGQVTEGPGFNVFMVKRGVVRTIDHGVLEGVSRRTVIECCRSLGVPIEIGPLREDEFRAADEVFLSSTGGGVLPIARLDGVPLPAFPGPVTQKLHAAYWALREDPRHRDPVRYA